MATQHRRQPSTRAKQVIRQDENANQQVQNHLQGKTLRQSAGTALASKANNVTVTSTAAAAAAVAAAHSQSFLPKGNVSANPLKAGAKRTALGDVSNRGTAALQPQQKTVVIDATSNAGLSARPVRPLKDAFVPSHMLAAPQSAVPRTHSAPLDRQQSLVDVKPMQHVIDLEVDDMVDDDATEVSDEIEEEHQSEAFGEDEDDLAGDEGEHFEAAAYFDDREHEDIHGSLDDVDTDMDLDAARRHKIHQSSNVLRPQSSSRANAPRPVSGFLDGSVVEPVYTKADRTELQRVATDFVDEWDEWNDISMVQEYADDIFAYLHTVERRLTPNCHYMHHQPDLEWKMRGILIDWLVQVHARFHLLPETLFLTINFIDRFLSVKSVSLHKLQLVGATALFLASKYEEIQCPSVSEIVYMVDNGYSADEILKAERFMIGMLDFDLGWPGPMSFLRRISKADDYDVDTRTVAKYLLEVMLMSHRFVGCPPSFSAAIAGYLARQILDKNHDWPDAHVYFSTYTERQIRPAAEIVLNECLLDARSHHAAIFEKYADRKQKKVSHYVEAWMVRRHHT
ncbi:B-type cyclin [Savitreella phatthalungensis]